MSRRISVRSVFSLRILTLFFCLYIYISEKNNGGVTQLHMQIGKRLFVKEIFYDTFIYFRLHGDVPRSWLREAIIGEKKKSGDICTPFPVISKNSEIMAFSFYFT